ncbi:helix-turn-helix domain-containing protein [Echinicola sp. CAU 1574]|uniref:Helix-turn-helix domain-containing protein n=1 Tax=Echinicola arenosa TaxID=2774144 RepID=A0ABR9AEV8_9BACT|nr:AraC family transcriptional regulator [Echinicola arenosa]MBD8487168.1 helix-turn-helix domain-containing protein [Echinicola arenosa]
MKRYKQFDDLIIDDFELSSWNHPLHNHNHYEIIFIAHGIGLHILNGQKIAYSQGDLFLLGPSDKHEFMIDEKTRFIYFKFTKRYINDPSPLTIPATWKSLSETLIKHPARKRGSLIKLDTDKKQTSRLMELIIVESLKPNSGQVIYQLFIALALIIKRNLKEDFYSSTSKPITEEILEYIDQNIRDPDKLTIQHLSTCFHLSPNYLGIWFKKQVGSSLREYIGEFRLKLILRLLEKQQLSNKQIAAEFGFVDESHLYKFVKTKTGKNLKEAANPSK